MVHISTGATSTEKRPKPHALKISQGKCVIRRHHVPHREVLSVTQASAMRHGHSADDSVTPAQLTSACLLTGSEAVAASPHLLPVLAASPAPRRCLVMGAGAGKALCGEVTEFCIEIRDQYGNRCIAPQGLQFAGR